MAIPEQWPKIKEIVGAALERESGERSAFLDQACAQDVELRAEVESLLAAHADAGGLSESPWLAGAATDPAGTSNAIGPYRLIHRLGVGGMGQVWLAEQTEPVRRRVALKLIRAGMYDSALIQRFQSERQSLAIMEHSAIAKVFDTGTTAEGQPYFAMEYVDGLPITEYCDRKKLEIRERLKLFLQVCDGVQHAHQKAIIHRDLKPSNILVTEVDGKPTPRIIDFGLAKATVPHALGETLFTQAGAFVGTPGYMSPEQADPNVNDIDTRTDVYSLGVVLYELLTGYLPFDTTLWKKQRLDEVLRQLREMNPERPSTKVGANRDTSTASARARNSEPPQLASLLRGDLDWITLKALEKERERRYGTPSALAADVERYLQNQPIEARPASAGYRLRKYIRRNRVAMTVASGVAALLIGFAVMQTVQLRRITRERDRADRVTKFMTNMFKVSDPSEARGNTVTAREILDKASKDIETGMEKDPELRAQMMITMGRVYLGLGLFPRAQLLFEKSAEIRRRLFGLRNRETLESMDLTAWSLDEQGQYQRSEQIEREILPIRRELLGPEDPDTLSSANNLAIELYGLGRLEESEKLDRETVAIRRRLRPEDGDTLMEMSNLAVTVSDRGHYREAEQLYNELLEVLTRTKGPDHPFTIIARSNLADVYVKEGRFAEAEKMNLELLQARRRVLGPEHPDTINNIGDVATTLYHEGRYSEAETMHRESLVLQRRVSGVEDPRTLSTMSSLAADLTAEGRYSEAEALSRQSLEVQRRVLGSDNPDTLASALNLAVVLRKQQRYLESEKLTQATLESERKIYGNVHPKCAFAVYSLAAIAAGQGKRDAALVLLREAIEHGLPLHESLAMETDPDLKPLHGDPRFTALVAETKERAGAATPKTN